MPSYHLWLKPSGEAYERLASAIRELADKLKAPIFEPHVTLLSPLSGTEEEHRRRTKQLAQRLRPFPIILIEPAYRDEYFQCVFMKAVDTPQLMEARTQARHLFSHAGRDVYMPHVSLLYGLYPTELKQELIGALPPDLRMTFGATAVHLVRSDSDDPKDWHEISAIAMEARPATGTGNDR
ncbi:MAG: 2'-5' RNA ligase family protein [Nitrospiraceae bacterium]